VTPRRRALVSLSAALCLLLAAGIPALAAGGSPRLLRFDDTTRFAVRPATLSFGADGGVLVLGPGVTQASFQARHDGHIRWAAWSATGAQGAGTVWINQCRPDCAAGHYTSYPVSLHASRVVNGRYTRLALSYQRGSQPTVKRYRLIRFGSLYGWQ
jgi:hypothetical protein